MPETQKPAPEPETAPAKRLTLSAILELLLTRSSRDYSSVSLGRNAAGVAQFDVTIRTGESEDVLTVDDAERKAREIYDRLSDAYPAPNGHDNAEVTLTRNAKGETQVSVSAKTSGTGTTSVARLMGKTREAYDAARMHYPMADGYAGKPGSVR